MDKAATADSPNEQSFRLYSAILALLTVGSGLLLRLLFALRTAAFEPTENENPFDPFCFPLRPLRLCVERF
jgi:hypothetical protein